MSADVTKELLIKIGTEGGEDAGNMFANMDLSFNRMMGSIVGINSAWDLFNKVIGVAKRAMSEVWEQAQNFVDTGAKFEQLGIRFETIFGGSGPAQAALDWAVKFAATTPLTLEDVTAKMLKLKAYGFDPMNGMLETIGNAAYAVGADFNGIIVALGQMGLKGKVVQQELNQLSERNIPAIKWLKEELGLTGDQMKNIGELAISSDTAIKIILDRMSKEYAGGLKRAGDSWLGALSTIQDIYVIFQKNLMDSGPFEFLVRNVRDVRDAFAEWSEYMGANLAFRAGGLITDYLKYAKDLLFEDLIPLMKSLANTAISLGTTLIPFWNIMVDIAGLVGGPLIAGFEAVFGQTAKFAATIDPFLDALRDKTIPYLVRSFLDATGAVIFGVQDALTWASAGIMTFINDARMALGSLVADMAYSSAGGKLLGAMGLDQDEIATFGLGLIAAANRNDQAIANYVTTTKSGLKDQRSAWESFTSGVVKGADKMFNAFDFLKIRTSDPFGLSRLSAGAGEGKAKVLWQQDVNEKTGGTTLYGEDTTMGGTQRGIIQLGAPPGDPLLNLIVDYINRAIQAEGTIGAGF